MRTRLFAKGATVCAAAALGLLAFGLGATPAAAAKAPIVNGFSVQPAVVIDGLGPAQIEITRPSTYTKAAAVLFSTIAGTATGTSFEVITKRQVIFDKDVLSLKTPVSIYDNGLVQSSKTFTVQIAPYKGSKIRDASATVSIYDNVIRNGGFENVGDFIPWTVATSGYLGGMALDTATLHSGANQSSTQSLKLWSGGNGTNAYAEQSFTIPATNAQNLHVWYKPQIASGDNATITLTTQTAVITLPTILSTASQVWTDIPTTLLWPYAGQNATLKIQINTTSSALSTLYIDDVQVAYAG